MLWVFKRTVSIRRFFLVPKKYVKTDELENIYNLTLKNCVYLNLCNIHSELVSKTTLTRLYLCF